MKIILEGHKNFEKNFKFKFLKPKTRIHTNGFLSVELDWTNLECDEFYKFKYANLAHRTYGGDFYVGKKRYINTVSASFEFEEAIQECEAAEITPWFNILIAEEQGEFLEPFTNEYDYIFFENTKYGLICWFAPKGWQDWSNAKEYKN